MSKRRAHYCVRIANAICEKVALGFSLKGALEEVGPLAPAMPTLWRWLDEFPEFRVKYERARQMQGDVLADEILDMAKLVISKPSLASAVRVASDILMWQAGIRDTKYNAKAPPEAVRKALPPDVLRAEILKLEGELGVKATPAMNTAPNAAQRAAREAAAAQPSPAQNGTYADDSGELNEHG